MPPAEGRAGLDRLPLRWVVLPALLATVALALGEGTDVDRAVTRLLFDVQASAFTLRQNFWLDVVMHHWAKYAVVMLGCLVAGGLVLSFVLPALKPHRRVLLFVVLSLSLAPLSVALGKAASTRHCPWDIDEFGGHVPYTRFFEPSPPHVESGRCFPAGHASTGFALMAFYFAAHAWGKRRAAQVALWIGIAAGVTLGMGRVLQGAHFVSHVVWSGLLCWMVMVVLYSTVFRAQPAGLSSAPASSA